MDMFLRMIKTKAPLTIAGVILIGVVGSAIYDAIVKPGFNMVSKVFFDLITFGSQTVRDYAFSNAALDPTALPSMLIFLTMSGIFFGMILIVNLKVRRRGKKPVTSSSEVSGSGKIVQKDFSELDMKKARRIRYVDWFIDGFMIATLFITITVMNQSILVWRVYNANEKIIAPYVTSSDLLKIKSQFSQIKTEKQYRDLFEAMQSVALKNKIELRSESTW
ncbi:hypothetical protein HBO01_20375 [Pseudomonas rhodesiae]|uniref:hypothetical protein n=1 Tax=Pseudomonas rhodesiae TaxID=76760 RepID=UPI0014740A7F|nr:hypothetical protein [Pseudomonas rhodesiae]NMY81044.1 hypothetical protein [Pseudomonas rhodesiae]